MPTIQSQLAADLAALIIRAQTAAAARDEPAMKSAHADLANFIERSDDTLPGVPELDNLAASTMRDLTLARLGNALDTDLAGRTGELAILAKRFRDQSATNRAAAATISLDRVQSLITAATTLVEEVQRSDQLTNADSPEGRRLAEAIRAVLAAIEAANLRPG